MKIFVYRDLLLSLISTALLLFTLTPTFAQEATEAQIDMEGMSIIGNNELPKALFIVPWKDAEAPVSPDRPLNSLVNDELKPVDPDIFRRYLQYLDQLHTSGLKTGDVVHDNN